MVFIRGSKWNKSSCLYIFLMHHCWSACIISQGRLMKSCKSHTRPRRHSCLKQPEEITNLTQSEHKCFVRQAWLTSPRSIFPLSFLGFYFSLINMLEFAFFCCRDGKEGDSGSDLSCQTSLRNSAVWGPAVAACLPAFLSSPTQNLPTNHTGFWKGSWKCQRLLILLRRLCVPLRILMYEWERPTLFMSDYKESENLLKTGMLWLSAWGKWEACKTLLF